jgi:hypothetical protein
MACCLGVDPEGMGTPTEVEADATVVELVADAVTGTVSGFTGVFLKGLRNQSGLSSPFVDEVGLRDPSSFVFIAAMVDADLPDPVERTDTWDGDVLNLTVASESLLSSSGRCGDVPGSPMDVRYGLSSIGSMGGMLLSDEVEITEFRCEFWIERRSDHDWAMTVPLPDEANELRLIVPGRGSLRKVKVSRSNFSASAWVMGLGALERIGESVGPISRPSGRKGTSIPERTSWSRRPNI